MLKYENIKRIFNFYFNFCPSADGLHSAFFIMPSPFSPLKFYFVCFAVLVLFFFFSWWPCLQIDLFVHSEPLVADFKVGLDVLAKKVVFNLGILPAEIVDIGEKENRPEYSFQDILQEQGSDRVMIFRRADLEDLIKFKIEELNSRDSSRTDPVTRRGKKIFRLQPEKWKMEVKNKDFPAGQAELAVFIQEEMIENYDFDELKGMIKSKKLREAESELEKISSIRKIEMEIHPRFWRRVPSFLNRIAFRVIPANVSSTPH